MANYRGPNNTAKTFNTTNVWETIEELQQNVGGSNGASLGNRLSSVESSLADKANQSDLLLKADKVYVDTQIGNIGSATPKGAYSTLTDLQTAFPTGTNGIYLVTADGGWYYWDNAWLKGGTYQSTGMADSSVTLDHLQNGSSLLAYNPNGIESTFPAEMKGDYRVLMSAKSDFIISNGNLADKLNIPLQKTTVNGVTVDLTTNDTITITGTANANTYFRIDGTNIIGQANNTGLGSKNYSIPADGNYKIVLYPTSQVVTGTSPSINIRKSDNTTNLVQLLLNASTLVSADFNYVDSQAGALYLYVPSGTNLNFSAKIALVPSIKKNYSSYIAPSNQTKTLRSYVGYGTDDFILSNNTGKVYGLSRVDRQMKVIKTGNNITIYVPCKTTRNFIQYNYTRVDDADHKFYQWRVKQTFVVDENYNQLFAFDDDTEWEGAVWEQGQSTFIGGYHGYETNQTFHIFIDSIPYSISGNDFIVHAKNEIRVVNVSVLNRFATANDKVFDRYRVNIWTKDHYIIENKLVASQNFNIHQAKMGLMSCKYNYTDANSVTKELVTNARTDHDYTITDMTTDFSTRGVGIRQKDITRFELWGNNSGVYQRMELMYLDNNQSNYPNRNQYVEDFRSVGDNRCKAYFDVTGDYSMVAGEALRTKTIIYLSA